MDLLLEYIKDKELIGNINLILFSCLVLFLLLEFVFKFKIKDKRLTLFVICIIIIILILNFVNVVLREGKSGFWDLVIWYSSIAFFVLIRKFGPKIVCWYDNKIDEIVRNKFEK
jgi:hypothetical protein